MAMPGPFDDLEPDRPDRDETVEQARGVPAPEDEDATTPAFEGDRLRRPTAATGRAAAARRAPPNRETPVDRRPRRDGSRPPRHDPRNRPEVGGFRAFVRGVARHCPRCGSGHLFASWFKIRERCPRCGFRLEREEGGFLGAMTINYTVTAVVWLAVFVVWLVLDLPDVHVLRLTIVSLAIAVVVPLLFWPFSKTLWAVVDYLVTESEAGPVPEDLEASGR
jgi:uncharacterized protein (DUF983 family)